MLERLEIIKKRYEELNEELLNPEVLKDIKKTRELSKEAKNLEETVSTYEEYKKVLEDIDAAKEMAKDPEMGEFARDELESLETKKTDLENKIEILLIPKDPNDGKNVIVEIRGAAGGDEANIFAGDLYRMYLKYAEKQGWKVEPITEEYSEGGGFTLVSFMVKGDNVYSKLKYESGSHRVQRVPETESQGRVHTSTATVVVMPELEDINIDINESDLKIDVYHSSGAGGQSVNTSNSAVRITHIPTGVVVACQNERSQLKNKEIAMKLLKIKINDELQQKQLEANHAERKRKVGTGDRSEKIRTYNYPQNRLTDHRINYTVMHLDKIMEGDLEDLIEALIAEDERMRLEENHD
jgi:peptide chain release factor 1